MKGCAHSTPVLPELHELNMDAPEISMSSLLSTQQQLALMRLVRANDPAGKQQLVAHSLRLVINIARHYGNHSVALLDLFREGVKGLIHALEHFDLDGGFRLSVYARQCIRHSIERFILDQITHSTFSGLPCRAIP